MYIHAREKGAEDIKVLDLNTGEFLDWILEACENENNGWYTQLLRDSDNNAKKCEHCGQFLHKRFRNVKIKLVYSPVKER